LLAGVDAVNSISAAILLRQAIGKRYLRSSFCAEWDKATGDRAYLPPIQPSQSMMALVRDAGL
jgi:hypothetical protein